MYADRPSDDIRYTHVPLLHQFPDLAFSVVGDVYLESFHDSLSMAGTRMTLIYQQQSIL